MIKTNLKAITTGFVTALMALPLILTAIPAGAIGEGQIEGGDIYRSRNLTQGTDFADPTSAEPCDTLQYKVRIHNPGPGEIKEVTVSVDLPSGASQTNVSSVTISAQNAQPSSTSDTATVNLSSAQSISYISGSTQLLDENSGVISNLPDGITSGGVNIGKVGISIEKLRFVQFKAEVDCPPPPKPEKPKFSCDALNVKIDNNRRVTATVDATAENGAQITQYRFDFGDGSDEVASETNSVSHSYSSPGSFTIVAKVDVNVDGERKTAAGEQCVAKVNFPKKPEQPPEVVTVAPPSAPPTAPSALPSAGPGDAVAAAVFSITVASTAAYYVVVRRLSML